MRLVIYGNPATKKNHQRIVYVKGSQRVIQSSRYVAYEKEAVAQIQSVILHPLMIETPINVKCTYFMETRRKVDLSNLISATSDVLVKAGVIKDDNSDIIKSYDGCRVAHDKELPRVEIEITEVCND